MKIGRNASTRSLPHDNPAHITKPSYSGITPCILTASWGLWRLTQAIWADKVNSRCRARVIVKKGNAMHYFLFLLYALVLVACEEAKQTKPERTADRALEYNNGLNITTRFHLDNHLGTKSVSGLSAPEVTWRFLSHRKRFKHIDVSGVCKVDWRNETQNSIHGYYHIVFRDENGFSLAYVFDRPIDYTCQFSRIDILQIHDKSGRSWRCQFGKNRTGRLHHK